MPEEGAVSTLTNETGGGKTELSGDGSSSLPADAGPGPREIEAPLHKDGPGMLDPALNFKIDGDLVGTVEQEQETPTPPPGADTDPEKAKKIEGSEEDKAAAAEAAKLETDKPGGEAGRFDEHPRFKELIKLKNEQALSIEKLRLENATLTGQIGSGKSDDTGKPAMEYTDIAGMTEEQIAEGLAEDPKGFMSNFAKQVFVEVHAKVTEDVSAKNLEDQTNTTYAQFAADHPGFSEKWDSGELKRYVTANPGHNLMSAYSELTQKSDLTGLQTLIDEAVGKAVKETEAKTLENIRAKRGAALLPAAPSTEGKLPAGEAPELKDPNKYGGDTAVLVARLKASRQGA